jgi:hypothetical protein
MTIARKVAAQISAGLDTPGEAGNATCRLYFLLAHELQHCQGITSERLAIEGAIDMMRDLAPECLGKGAWPSWVGYEFAAALSILKQVIHVPFDPKLATLLLKNDGYMHLDGSGESRPGGRQKSIAPGASNSLKLSWPSDTVAPVAGAGGMLSDLVAPSGLGATPVLWDRGKKLVIASY